MTVIGLVVALLFLAGLVGSVLPGLPGPALVAAGALVWALATNFETLGVGRLAVLGALAALAFVLDLVAGAVGARRYGASRLGMAGAIVGALVGLFLGPVGLIVGCVVGAVAGELARGADLARGVRAGAGALIGLLAGLATDLVVSVTMIGLFLYWVWRG
jgi:uncharacterized protein YqgC (DUF456 family)